MAFPKPSVLIRAIAAGMLTGVSGSAFAGINNGIIVFAPDSIAVPALNGPMLAVLGLLMAVVAYRIFRSSNGGFGRMASVLVVAGGTILAGVGGSATLRAVVIDPIIKPEPEQCTSGGQIEFASPGENEFQNTCPNALVITRLECDPINSGSVVLNQRADVVDDCEVDLRLDPDQRCGLPPCHLD